MNSLFTRLNQLIEAACNFAFYLFAFLIVLLPPLVSINNGLSGRTGFLWVLAALAFAIVAPVAVQLLGESFMDVVKKIRKGELLKEFLKPFRNVAAVLGIYGAFKVEYAQVHGIEEVEFGALMDFLWKFLTAF